MNYIQVSILFCIKQLKGERTAYGIYHLLTGKKSAQTIQDGKIFGISFLFQSFVYLDKRSFETCVAYLKEQQYIEETENQKYVMTDKGQARLEDELTARPFHPALDGWKFASSTQLFLARITLFIQTLSNLQYFQKGFLPISKNPEVIQWVKTYIMSQKQTRQELAAELFEELRTCLKGCTERDASLFVLQLTGYQRVGFTKNQLAYQYELDEHYVHIQLLGVIHHIIEKVSKNNESFHVLSSFLRDLYLELPLTSSTLKTYSWLQKGKTLEEIAYIRRLKESTIEDHIAELALFVPSFSIDAYVSPKQQEEIVSAFEGSRTNKLKVIKEEVKDDVTYFQIRLVLAKHFT